MDKALLLLFMLLILGACDKQDSIPESAVTPPVVSESEATESESPQSVEPVSSSESSSEAEVIVPSSSEAAVIVPAPPSSEKPSPPPVSKPMVPANSESVYLTSEVKTIDIHDIRKGREYEKLIIHNESSYVLVYPYAFSIERFDGNEWQDLKQENNKPLYPSHSPTINPGETEISSDFRDIIVTWLYDDVPSTGTYRIHRSAAPVINMEATGDAFDIYYYFEIVNSSGEIREFPPVSVESVSLSGPAAISIKDIGNTLSRGDIILHNGSWYELSWKSDLILERLAGDDSWVEMPYSAPVAELKSGSYVARESRDTYLADLYYLLSRLANKDDISPGSYRVRGAFRQWTLKGDAEPVTIYHYFEITE